MNNPKRLAPGHYEYRGYKIEQNGRIWLIRENGEVVDKCDSYAESVNIIDERDHPADEKLLSL